MMISAFKPMMTKLSFGTTHASGSTADRICSKEIKPQKPSNEELRAAGYPMTYTTPAGDVWHRNLAAELGRSDDLDCDDPDAKIEPGDSYMSDDVFQFMKKANSNN